MTTKFYSMYDRTNAGEIALKRGLTQVGLPYIWGGESPGIGFDCCLVGETLVPCERGSVRLDELTTSDVVVGFVDGQEVPAQVVAWKAQGIQETFAVKTRNRTVVATANHPFLVAVREPRPAIGVPVQWSFLWKRVDELVRGDLLVSMEERIEKNREDGDVDADLAWLIGLWVGDGSASVAKNGIQICVYGDVRERASSIIKERFDKTPSYGPSYGLAFTSKEFNEFLFTEGFVHKSYDKIIPPIVWKWSNKLQRAFLEGYATADGHYNEGRFDQSYASSSLDLLTKARMMHISLGDRVSNITVNPRKNPITINGVAVKNARPLYGFSVYVPRGGGARRGCSDLRKNYGLGRLLPDDAWGVQRVTSIEPRGPQETFDIETTTGSFVADGIVVHNSGLTQWIYATVGVPISRSTFYQFNEYQIVRGDPLLPGDLLFIPGSDGTPNRPGHVMVYHSPGKILQSPFTGEDVQVSDYNTSVYVFATRPANYYGAAITAPTAGQLKANGLVHLTDQAQETLALRNGWVVRGFDGSTFLPLPLNGVAVGVVKYAPVGFRKPKPAPHGAPRPTTPTAA
jgi:hypothetical protein